MFSIASMLLMPEGFYVVCISLFEFGFCDAIIYFVLVDVLFDVKIALYMMLLVLVTSIGRTIQESVIIFADGRFYVRHTTIAYFYAVLIKKLV